MRFLSPCGAHLRRARACCKLQVSEAFFHATHQSRPHSAPHMTPALADLRAFVTVAHQQSFAAAAKALHLSQPALSRRISKLEEQLGVRLLDRTTRSVELTLLGRRFLQEIAALVDDMDRSVA